MKTKPHLVLFVESYPHIMAGQQRTMLSLLAEASQQRLSPMLLVPAEGQFVETVRQRGIHALVVPYGGQLGRYGGQIYRDNWLSRGRTLVEWSKYAARCRFVLKRLRPAALFCNDMRGLLTVGIAARSLGIPVMIWDKLDKPHGLLDWFQLPIAHQNAIISESVMNKYPRWQRSWYGRRIKRIPNGADIERFQRGTPIRSQLEIDDSEVVVAMVGTVTHRKAPDRLLKLVPKLHARVPNIRVIFVGSWEDSDEDRRYFESLPNRNHPCVTFLGQRDHIEDIINSIDILAIPSRHEGMGQVTVEAMAAGKPVVGANAGGIPEVVQHEQTGLIFEGQDSDQFLQHLVRLASSPYERQQLGEAGRRRVQLHFNRSQQIGKLIESLRSLIDQ